MSSGSRDVSCGRTDKTEFIVAFRNVVTAPKTQADEDTETSEETAFNKVHFSQFSIAKKPNLNIGDGGRIPGRGSGHFTLLFMIHNRSYLMDNMYCFSRSKERGTSSWLPTISKPVPLVYVV